MPALAKKLTRMTLLLAVGFVAVLLGGCGRTTETAVTQQDLSAGGTEPYFNVGAVTYQVQISRQLNPFDPEDVQYLAGVKDAQNITPSQLWFGVFLWAKNQTRQVRDTADHFELEDSAGTVFKPTPLNASLNPFAWTRQPLDQNGIEPADGTIAANDSSGGGLVLFKLNEAVYSNRPLDLLIFQPGTNQPHRISLDL